MRYLRIKRLYENALQTIGIGYVMDKNDNIIMPFFTLELPYLDNECFKSSIPCGIYNIHKHHFERFGKKVLRKIINFER